jgi:hypothetical protein
MTFEFCMVGFFWSIAAFIGLWLVADAIERAAQRGERIYLARNRDHAAVPCIRWRDEA